MSNIAWHTTLAATDTLETWRTGINANFAQARELTLVEKDADYTVVQAEDVVDVDATSGAVSIDLPPSPTTGDTYTVRKADGGGNAVTIDGNGKNINGSSTKALSSQYDAATVVYNGTEWAVIAEV